MPILNPRELFDEVAGTLAYNLTNNPQLQGGDNRVRAFRFVLRALARFCKLRYADCQIEKRITELEPPYVSPEQFAAQMKDFLGWSDEKCEDYVAAWRGKA
jgi:hypothetical protein